MRKGFSLILTLTFMVTLLGTLSCGKPDIDPKTSIITLNLPEEMFKYLDETELARDPRTTATLTTNFIVVNITGPGISQRIYFNWERCHSYGCTDVTPPTSINLAVPSGSDRFIQVMAVRDSDSNNSSTGITSLATDPTSIIDTDKNRFYIYYGEQKVTLNTAETDITMNLNSVSPSGFTPRDVIGRYLTSADAGPSGPVYVYFMPPSGINEFLIERTYIINGWLNFFGADNLRLIYRLADTNQVIFDTVANLASYNERVMRVDSPSAFSVYVSSNTNVNIYSNGYNPSTIYGFFGPGVTASHVVCYPESLTGREVKNYVYSASNYNGYYIYNAGYSPLKWYSTPNTSHMSRIGGGVVNTDPRCASTYDLSSAFNFDYRRFGGNRGAHIKAAAPYTIPTVTASDAATYYIWDATSPTQFAFTALSTNTVDASNYDVKVWFEYLRGTIPTIAGTTVFYARYSLVSSGGNDDCTTLKDNPNYSNKTFPVTAGVYSYKDQALGTFPSSYFVSSTSSPGDYLQGYLCPYVIKDGAVKYLDSENNRLEIRPNTTSGSSAPNCTTLITTTTFNSSSDFYNDSKLSPDYMTCLIQAEDSSSGSQFNITTMENIAPGYIYLAYSNNGGTKHVTKLLIAATGAFQIRFHTWDYNNGFIGVNNQTATDVAGNPNYYFDFETGNQSLTSNASTDDFQFGSVQDIIPQGYTRFKRLL